MDEKKQRREEGSEERSEPQARRESGVEPGEMDVAQHCPGVSSDNCWRSVLLGLGVDVAGDSEWRGKAKAACPKQRHSSSDGLIDSAGSSQGKGRKEMEEKAQWVNESEVSIEKLHELFDSAYMECDLDEDGDLRVLTDSGPRIFLSLHEPNKLIRYMAFYKFRDDVAEYEKLFFANALNDDIVFIRFSLNGSDTLIADYYLPYSRGTSPFQVVNAAKLMGRVITSGIRQHDTGNILE